MQHIPKEVVVATAATLGAATPAPDIPWQVVTFLLTAVIGIYSWVTKRSSAAQHELVQLQAKVAVLEERMSGLPTSREVMQLNVNMAQLNGELEGATASMRALHLRLDRVEDFMKQVKVGGG